jgi:glyoxylase-like metal-dependent hydrolase (beta-lactamase superfamily II)
LLCSVAVAPARAQDWEAVEIETIDVAPGVYMLVGRGGNIGVSAGEDGIFLVDDQYAPLTDKIVAALRAISDAPIRFVINTHWHGDHTGGNENLGEIGTLIVAHENVRKRMTVEQFIEAIGDTVPPAPEGALPVVTFTDAVTFHLNGDDIRVFHVEHAHTDGDAVIHFPGADVIHAGDVYFNGTYPFIDVSSGGSIDGTIAAVDAILAIAGENTRIIPGHGPLSNRTELAAYRDMLRGTRDAVAAAIRQGKSLDEVVAAKPTAKWDTQWGGGFIAPERFVRGLFGDLSRER